MLSIITPAVLRVEADLSVPGEEGVEAVPIEAEEAEGEEGAEGAEAPAEGEGRRRGSGRRGGRREPSPWPGSSPGWAIPATGTRTPGTTSAAWSWTSWRAPTGERFRRPGSCPPSSPRSMRRASSVLLVRSTHFMNESGPSYAGVAKKRDIEPDRRDRGPRRARHPGRHAAGQARRRHARVTTDCGRLQRSLRTPEFLRVRVGIGRPPGRQDPADFVLDADPASVRRT